jgi:hypothetical protein
MSPNGPSLDEEEKALRKGRGRMVLAMAMAVLAAIGGIAWFVGSQQPSEFSQIGRQINRLRSEHFDAFYGCVLPRADLRDIRNDRQLRSAIAERATNPRAYAEHIRGECMVRLEEHGSPLSALIVPAELTAPVGQLQSALDAQRAAWTRFIAFLEQTDGAFDSEAADEYLSAIARGWFDYKIAHGAINDIVRAQIDE